jgi:hypothetical protein
MRSLEAWFDQWPASHSYPFGHPPSGTQPSGGFFRGDDIHHGQLHKQSNLNHKSQQQQKQQQSQ